MRGDRRAGERGRRVPASALLMVVLPASALGAPQRHVERAGLQPSATFVGASVCASCHAEVHEKWSASRHSKMVQPATAETVDGDFGRVEVTLRGERYRLEEKNGQYFISESYFTGEERKHRVDYTLGRRRFQHYLTTLEDGRIIVLPPSWDVMRGEWFHNMVGILEPEWDERNQLQLWNKNCYGCHVSQERKNFDPETQTYSTDWLDFGTNCESCHGPGSEHVASYSGVESPDADPTSLIVRQTRLDNVTNTMVCAQCHSSRDILAPGFTAGQNYYDYFLPLLEYSQGVGDNPMYWPDGRPRRFSNNALALWQSECFLRGGVACTDCHIEPHNPEIEENPQLRPGNETLCTGCHETIGRSPPAHTRHEPESRGSSCVDCHMPRTVVGIRGETIRDHTIAVPTPESTLHHHVPNACNVCHEERGPRWAIGVLERWFPNRRREKLLRRAQAFTMARNGDSQAVGDLIAIATNPREGPLARANALGHLGRFSEPEATATLVDATRGEHPLIRAVAALTLGQPASGGTLAVITRLAEALDDPVRSVRMSAALSLANLGGAKLEGERLERFASAKRDIVRRADMNDDDPEAQVNLGKFYLLLGEPDEAMVAFRASLSLDPDQQSTYYFMALARLSQQRVGEARKLLRKISSSDPLFESARALLDRLEERP